MSHAPESPSMLSVGAAPEQQAQQARWSSGALVRPFYFRDNVTNDRFTINARTERTAVRRATNRAGHRDLDLLWRGIA
jgi:hypothetical protein